MSIAAHIVSLCPGLCHAVSIREQLKKMLQRFRVKLVSCEGATRGSAHVVQAFLHPVAFSAACVYFSTCRGGSPGATMHCVRVLCQRCSTPLLRMFLVCVCVFLYVFRREFWEEDVMITCDRCDQSPLISLLSFCPVFCA